MERNFDLIKNQSQNVEKRVFPRFPFYYLLFKDLQKGGERVFEVQDVSLSGMQLGLKDGQHTHRPGEKLEGKIYWKGDILDVEAEVKWGHGAKMGVAFLPSDNWNEKVKVFFSPEKVVQHMRPVNLEDPQMEYPAHLKYWLHAGRFMEIFLWKHLQGEWSNFQVLFLKEFVEWEDGRGLTTGKILNSRSHDTPLTNEDEFVFSVDSQRDEQKMEWARQIVAHIPEDLLPQKVIDFIKVKLS
jgi:hypothetical protein